jgi:hypothetical protein
MSVTRNLQSSALFSMPFLGYQPVNISNGEPAITAANLTKQTILGPPFKWNHNRASFSFPTEPNDQDYFLPLTDFGFLERVTLTDSKGVVKEIEIQQSLAAESRLYLEFLQKHPLAAPTGRVRTARPRPKVAINHPDGFVRYVNTSWTNVRDLMAKATSTRKPDVPQVTVEDCFDDSSSSSSDGGGGSDNDTLRGAKNMEPSVGQLGRSTTPDGAPPLQAEEAVAQPSLPGVSFGKLLSRNQLAKQLLGSYLTAPAFARMWSDGMLNLPQEGVEALKEAIGQLRASNGWVGPLDPASTGST